MNYKMKTLALLSQAVASGGNFALGVLLARWLGVEAFGRYSLLWMGVLFLLSLHQAYITQPFMTLVAGKETGEKEAYCHSISMVQLVLSIVLPVLASLAFFILKIMGYMADWLSWLPLGGCIAAAYLWHDFLKKYFFAERRPQYPLLMDSAVFIALLPILGLLHQLNILQIETALWAILGSYCLGVGVGIIGTKTSFVKNINLNQLSKTAKEHYHYSFWLLGTSLVQWFSSNFFLVAAAGTLGAVAVGALRMAQNMVGLCHVLFLAMENIVPVEAARQFFTKGEKAMYGYLQRVAILGGLPVLGLLGLLTLAAPWLIDWLYGTDYQPFAHLVAAYSVVYSLGFVATILRFAMRSMSYTLPFFVAYAASAGVSVLAAKPMVQAWGMNGVVAGLIGAQVLILLVYAVFIVKKPAPSRILTSPNPQILKS